MKVILLVEDDFLIALSERLDLETNGYRVIEAHCGEDAVAIAVSGDEKIDLILMDVNLGRGMDGIESAKEILKRRDLPILFLTAQRECDFRGRIETVSYCGFVNKGSARVDLEEAIFSVIGLYEPAQAATYRGSRLEAFPNLGEKSYQPRR
jgi:CheY-like chemotaxis protein